MSSTVTPLRRAVIGGVITSTLLTLLVIPTLYEILDGWRERLRARWHRRGRGHGHAPLSQVEGR
jgi:HAE1 family hydrophobic/amphiphilic exporter-1